MNALNESALLGKPVIFSVRHGESVTNVNRDLHHRVSDPAVWLTEKGHSQAQEAGQFLARRLIALPAHERPKKLRIMRSFYRRAVQTAKHIEAALRASGPDIEISVKEDPRLRELEYGYTGALEEPLPHVEWLANITRYQGYKYLSPRFGGESPAHMEPRVRLILSAIYRDLSENGITHFVVVSHGITCRVLTKARYGYGNDWYEAEPNPDNCSIRLMGETDEGYIFPNAQGQWKPDWTPEYPEAGSPKLNPEGLFFSPAEMEQLIAAQAENPTLMAEFDRLFRAEPMITASAAITRILG